MSRLFCDTNCELWFEKAKELGLSVIRMPYNINNVEYYYDLGENTDFVKFFDEMRSGAMAKTSALNEADYINYFEPVLAGGEDILYIHFSSQMSGTFTSMKSAIEFLKQKYPERTIKTVDTKAISICAGSIVYYAAQLWKSGATDEEIIKWVEENKLHFSAYFIVDDLKYLKNGGRISGATKFFGSMLGIKPLLYMSNEGKVEKIDAVKGFRNGVDALFEKICALGSEIEKFDTYIIHADNLQYAEYLKEKVCKKYEKANVIVQYVGPVIGSHCGPGTLGIVFHSKCR